MPVITISRQYGSLGDEIGRDVAEQSKRRFVNQDTLRDVAIRLGVPATGVTGRDERGGTVVSDLVQTMRLLYPATVMPPAPEEEQEPDEAAHLQIIREVVWEVARAGNALIIGRGGAFILPRHPGTLHVLIVAPLDVRIERIMAVEGLDSDHAAQRVKQVDGNRARYIRHFYRTNWLDVEHYDLVVNTGHFSQVRSVALVCAAASAEQTVGSNPLQNP